MDIPPAVMVILAFGFGFVTLLPKEIDAEGFGFGLDVTTVLFSVIFALWRVPPNEIDMMKGSRLRDVLFHTI